MSADESVQAFHDRATRGLALSAEEQSRLEAWYAKQEREEAIQLGLAPLPERPSENRTVVSPICGKTNMNNPTTHGRWTAAELRRLPLEQREAILEAAAALAAEDYRNDPDLTAFEAFGPDDLYGDSSSTETR